MYRYLTLLLFTLGLLLGCEEESTPGGRGLANERPPGAAIPPSFEAENTLQPEGESVVNSPLPAPGPRTVRSRRAAPDETEERDWEEELRAAATPLSTCVPAGENLPERLSLRLEATVSATGRVTRAYVSGSVASSDVRDCIRNRLLQAQFAPPESGGPRTIRSRLEAQREPTQAP